MKFAWTDANVALLKRYWAAGLSFSEIGARLGCSRSAVSGRLMRGGLIGNRALDAGSAERKRLQYLGEQRLRQRAFSTNEPTYLWPWDASA